MIDIRYYLDMGYVIILLNIHVNLIKTNSLFLFLSFIVLILNSRYLILYIYLFIFSLSPRVLTVLSLT